MNASTQLYPGYTDFGPTVNGCPNCFDFTLVFEESFLSIVPSTFILLAAPARLLLLRNQKPRLHEHAFRLMKLGTILVLGLLRLALVVIYATQPLQRDETTLAASSLSLIAVLFISGLSLYEHSRSIRPSSILSIYLFLSVLFDIARTRSVWLANNAVVASVFSAQFALEFVLLVLEAKEKMGWVAPVEKESRGPEEFAGVYNRSLFWWLNGLFRSGFKSVLTLADLYPVDEALAAATLNSTFWKGWEKSCDGKWRLIRALGRSFWVQLLAPVFPRLVNLAFTFAQPLLLNRFLDFLQEPDSDIDVGYGLIGAYAIVYFGLAVSNGIYLRLNTRSVTTVRGALVSIIYDQTTEISITELDNAAAVTLMSTDVERIVNAMRLLHEIWACILQIAIATWLLEKQVGVAALGPIIVCVVSGFLTGVIAGSAGPKQNVWAEKISERVGITAEVLSSMKGVKMSGLSEKMASYVRRLRSEEIDAGNGFRLVMVWSTATSFMPQLLSPVLTFAIFIGVSAHEHTPLDVSRVFTSLSLILLLAQPLTAMFQAIPTQLAGVACLGRIQKYLCAEKRHDTRLFTKSAASSLQSEKLLTPSTNLRAETAIHVQSGKFGWKDKPDVLREIDLSILKGSLTIITGPVASGKTTLLKALLGEVPHAEGIIEVSSQDASFCDQTPWIQNETIQKNIIGFAHLESAWYARVLDAAALTEDLKDLPQGDQTRVGSKGITLSGGQKQRVALARALYAKKQLVVLDDVFSGLDMKTHSQISERLFSQSGLLRGVTTIIATHSSKLLPLSDRIVVLSKEGNVVEQGTYTELYQAGGFVREAVKEEVEVEMHEEKTPESTSPETTQASELLNAQINPTSEEEADRQEEQNTRKDGDFKDYLYYFKAVGWITGSIFLIMETIESVAMVFPSAWLKLWTDATARGSSQTGLYLGVYTGLQVFAVLNIIMVCWFGLTVMVKKAGNFFHDVLLDTIFNAPMAFFAQTDVGTTTNRFSQDLQLIDGELPEALLDLFIGVLLVAGQAALIATASGYIAITFPFLICLLWVLQKYYLRTSRQMRLMDLEAKSPLYTQFLESISGLATIRAFGWQEENKQLNKMLLDASQKPFYLLYMIQRWLGLVLDLVAMALAVLIAGLSTGLRDSVSAGFAGVALVNLLSFTGFLKGLIVVWTLAETSIGAVARVRKINEEVKSENLIKETFQPPENWPSGEIVFENIKASYDEAGDRNAVDGVSLLIKAGQKVGICGRSGSGKSSLVTSLFRLVELRSGRISIDGLDLATIPRQRVRERIIGLPQDALLLKGSVRFNIDPYDDSSDDAMIDALKKVDLWKIWEGEGGLDAAMTIDSLSHGQRQLFSLARAILRPGNIVVLDEATSNVDKGTDDLMQRIIREEFKERTIIAVAHRLDTVIDFDLIVVMDKGKVVESDSPANLLGRDSMFRDLYRSS